MAGITPLVPPRIGYANGKIQIETEVPLTLDELCRYCQTEKAFLDELADKGWRYYFIDGYGKVVKEIDIASPYTFLVTEHPRGGFTYQLSFDFQRSMPDAVLKDIHSLDRFVVNVCSKDYPRGVTVNLASKEVTFVHESLWISKGDGCTEEAKDVLRILRWLVEEKGFKLALDDSDKYQELVNLLGDK